MQSLESVDRHINGFLPVEKPQNYIENNGQKKAQGDGSNNREIDLEFITLETEIVGELPDKWYFTPERQNQPEDNE